MGEIRSNLTLENTVDRGVVDRAHQPALTGIDRRGPAATNARSRRRCAWRETCR